MANTVQARKRARQAEKARQLNTSHRTRFKTSLKKVLTALETKDKSQAQAAYQQAVPIIDAMVNQGLIHKNKAARHKSRLNAHIRGL